MMPDNNTKRKKRQIMEEGQMIDLGIRVPKASGCGLGDTCNVYTAVTSFFSLYISVRLVSCKGGVLSDPSLCSPPHLSVPLATSSSQKMNHTRGNKKKTCRARGKITKP
jgi:hypothetical protein